MSNLKAKWTTVKPWLAAAVTVLSGNWVATELQRLLELPRKAESDRTYTMTDAAYLALYVALFVGAVVWLYRLRKMLFHPRTRLLRNEVPPPREHLVLFLSWLKGDNFQEGVPKGLTLTGNLDEDLASLEHHKKCHPYWPWEMPLRAVRHHIGKLKMITLICSPESIQQAHWFGQVLKQYGTLGHIRVSVLVKQNGSPALVPCPTNRIAAEGWDFEKFDDLSLGMLRLLDEFRAQGITDDQIIVDFTGGQKVTSVVAAAVTFNRAIKGQYVQTNEPFAVIGYDILLTSSETAGIGL